MEIRWAKGDHAGTTFAFGRNHDYSFGVERVGEGASWVISSVHEMDPDSAPIGLLRPVVEAVDEIVYAPIHLGLLPLAELASDPDFEILSCHEETLAPGRSVVSIRFRADADIGMGRRVHGGELAFAPDEFWMLVSGRLYCTWPGSSEAGLIALQTESGEVDSQFPVYKRYVEHVQASMLPIPEDHGEHLDDFLKLTAESQQDWQTDVQFAREYELHRIDSTPPDTFRLTRYGFPEPGGSQQRSWRTALFAANLLLIVLFACFFIWRRRREDVAADSRSSRPPK